MAFYGPTGHINVEVIDPSTGNVKQRLLIPSQCRAWRVGCKLRRQRCELHVCGRREATRGAFRPLHHPVGPAEWTSCPRTHPAVTEGHPQRRWSGGSGSTTPAPPPLAVFYASGGRHLVVVGDRRTSILDAGTGRILRSYGVRGGVAGLSPDGTTVVIGDQDSVVRFLDLHSGAITQSVTTLAGGITAVGFTPDGRTAGTERRPELAAVECG